MICNKTLLCKRLPRNLIQSLSNLSSHCPFFDFSSNLKMSIYAPSTLLFIHHLICPLKKSHSDPSVIVKRKVPLNIPFIITFPFEILSFLFIVASGFYGIRTKNPGYRLPGHSPPPPNILIFVIVIKDFTNF